MLARVIMSLTPRKQEIFAGTVSTMIMLHDSRCTAAVAHAVMVPGHQ